MSDKAALAAPTGMDRFTDMAGGSWSSRPGFASTLFEGNQVVTAIDSGYPSLRTRLSDEEGANDREALVFMEGVRRRVDLGMRLLDTLAPNTGRDDAALVVGASRGEECLWIAHHGASRVVGTNLTDEPLTDDRILQGYARAVNGRASIDLASSSLPSGSFGRMYSWQTLEHVMSPREALGEIFRLLRPGGAAFIEYNPFFSIDGAHWPATIDLPWAHVLLSQEEFRRAVFTLHTDRPPDAAEFVERAINRMTQAEVVRFAEAAGLRVAAALPRLRTEDLMRVDERLLRVAQSRFPSCTIADLATRIMRLVLCKPDPPRCGATESGGAHS